MADKEYPAKHLEFILDVIERLARNSFLLKGWSITLVAACFLLAVRGADHSLALFVALLPSLTFWGLDAYYLRQERMYRRLYDHVRTSSATVDPFTLDAKPFAIEVGSWFCVIWSGVLVWFHGAVIVVIIVALAFFELGGSNAP